MGLAEKTKYRVCLKQKDGEPMTTERCWLVKDSALTFMIKSLETGAFSWGALLTLTLNDELLTCSEYVNHKF